MTLFTLENTTFVLENVHTLIRYDIDTLLPSTEKRYVLVIDKLKFKFATKEERDTIYESFYKKLENLK